MARDMTPRDGFDALIHAQHTGGLAQLRDRLGPMPEPGQYKNIEADLARTREEVGDMVQDITLRSFAIAWYAGLVPTSRTSREGYNTWGSLTIPLSPNLSLSWTTQHEETDDQNFVVSLKTFGGERRTMIEGKNVSHIYDSSGLPPEIKITKYNSKPSGPGQGPRRYSFNMIEGNEAVSFYTRELRDTRFKGLNVHYRQLPKQADGTNYRVLSIGNLIAGTGFAPSAKRLETVSLSSDEMDTLAATVFTPIIEEILRIETYGVTALPEIEQ